MALQQPAVEAMPAVNAPPGFILREGEFAVAVTRSEPDDAFWGVCCSTSLGIVSALPCFWWALPCICGVQYGEASSARTRAYALYVVLTNRALYLHNDTLDSALRRIPLEEISKFYLADNESMRSGANFKTFTVVTRGNSKPVMRVESLLGGRLFVSQIYHARTLLAAEMRTNAAPAAATMMAPPPTVAHVQPAMGGGGGVGGMYPPPPLPQYPQQQYPPPSQLQQLYPQQQYPPQPQQHYPPPPPPQQQYPPPPPPQQQCPPPLPPQQQYPPQYPPPQQYPPPLLQQQFSPPQVPELTQPPVRPPSRPSSAQQVQSAVGGASVRVFCVLNSTPEKKVVVRTSATALGDVVDEMKRKLDVPADSQVRVFLRQGIEVSDVGDLVNDDFVILCLRDEALNVGALKNIQQ